MTRRGSAAFVRGDVFFVRAQGGSAEVPDAEVLIKPGQIESGASTAGEQLPQFGAFWLDIGRLRALWMLKMPGVVSLAIYPTQWVECRRSGDGFEDRVSMPRPRKEVTRFILRELSPPKP